MIAHKIGRLAGVGALAAAVIGMASSAFAQDTDSEPSQIAALRTCQSITDNSARLTCLDAAAASIVEASDAGDLRVVDREQVRKTRRKLFGLSLPDFGIFGKRDKTGSDQDEIDELETKIASVSGSFASGYLIRTTEDAVWRIEDVPRRLLTPKPGDSLLIKGGALSSYFIRINNQAGVRAVRVR